VNKEITFYIDNLAYTFNVDETMEKQLTKYLDPKKNNKTQDLLAAYVQISQEHIKFRDDVEQISAKLSRF